MQVGWLWRDNILAKGALISTKIYTVVSLA